jgi:hypothetical protein
MFGSDILEVATGIVFVFVLLSTICTSIREGLEGWFKTRASYLEFGIRELLQDRKGQGLARELFEHPLIFGLYAGDYAPGSTARPGVMTSGGNLPTYIPSRSFARALMDIAARGPVGAGAVPGVDPAMPENGQALSMARIRANVSKLENAAVRRVLIGAIDSAQGDFDRACAHIEHWYDSAMDRVSGWYKRSTQWALFWIALFVAVVLNVNTITISDYLYRHDAERAAIVSTIDKTAGVSGTDGGRYATAKSELKKLRLPMGWSAGWGAPRTREERGLEEPVGSDNLSYWEDVGAPVLGWLLTAVAAMLGAPFWFDVLNQIMVVRSTVKPHEKSGEEASRDRQAAQPMAQQPVFITAAPRVTVAEPSERDDPCGVGDGVGTPDDQLPPARGGVALR